jgi:hypothetical protein
MRYLLIIALAACSSVAGPAEKDDVVAQRGTQRRTVSQILADPTLWGPDFPSLLAQLEALQRTAERQVIVFRDRAVLSTPFKTEAEARSAAANIDRAMSELRSQPTALFNRMRSRGAITVLPAEVIAQFPEDRTARVALVAPALLAPNLTVSTVRQRLGPPESTTRQLIEGPGESRPLVLTLYAYGAGAVVFAEADIAPRPGFVNRVRLDVPSATAALAKE